MLLSIGFGLLAYNLFDNNFIFGNILVIIYITIAIFIEKLSLKIEKTTN